MPCIVFLANPCPAPTHPHPPLAANRIRGAGSNFLVKACARDSSTAGHHYVHVEAGIKLKDLLADLASCGLSIPTMGDGAGQSLIGMLSTATHGADLRVPPLIEWIRAGHLVGPTGQEIWVTPAASTPFGHAPLVTTLPGWCSDTRIVADNDAFNAVRVGVGRFGVVYALVLEVVPQFTLIEVNLEHRWSAIRPQLTMSQLQPTLGTDRSFQRPDRGPGLRIFSQRSAATDLLSGRCAQRRLHIRTCRAPRWPGVPAYFDSSPGCLLPHC